MNWSVRAMFATILITGGFVLGHFVIRQPTPAPPPAKVVGVPHYIAGPTKTVTKNVMPQACKDAIKAASQMQKATDAYEKTVGGLPGIIDKTGVAIEEKSIPDLNKQMQAQKQLEGDSIQALLDLREAQQNLDRLTPKCDAAMH